nr:ribonuclease H-like domain-containing protein [Tanacetum cinerariifolium]
KVRTTLPMALLEDHLEKIHWMAYAKEMWEAIKSRLGGNDESKKMQKYLLKQQFEGFSMSSLEGLHKGYDRFQTLLSRLEIHHAGVSNKDANQKFLSFDDLYNNLRVFERNVKGTTASSSSSNTQNVAFVSADNTSSTNDVAMISMRIKKFYKRTGRKLHLDTKDPVGFDKTKVEGFNCHKIGHFARDCRAKGNQDSRRRDAGYNGNKARDNSRRPAHHDDSKALVTMGGEDIDWSGHVEEDTKNYAMIAYSNSGSDNKVIEFGDSYEVPKSTMTTDTTSGETGMKSGRTVTLTSEDMQKKKNDVKARTTLLLSLLDEHQMPFSKYKTTQELWAAILKTFGGNEATKKTKEESSKAAFMEVEVEHDDLNQKFLTSLAPEWMMHTIVWRNRSDLDTMSLDDLYNHLKVYESEVQKKSEPKSQNMTFISSAKHSNGSEDGNTACVPTANINVPTASASVATISQDTACAYIASQSSGSQIKFEDINQIDEDDIEEMDIKWNMALLSMKADKF